MSTYITATGELVFPNINDFNESLQILTQGGWICPKDLLWLDEGGTTVTDDDCVLIDELTLIFPDSYYRNLSRVIHSILSNAESGLFKCSTTDGCYELFIWSGGECRRVTEPDEILLLSRDNSQEAKDLFALDCCEWEEKYDECDFSEYLSDLMFDALDKLNDAFFITKTKIISYRKTKSKIGSRYVRVISTKLSL